MGREEIDTAFEQQQEVIKSSPVIKHLTFIVLALAGFGFYHLVILIYNTLNKLL